MAVENIQRIIKKLNAQKREIKKNIKKFGDDDGYLSKQMEEIDQRKEMYVKRLENRKKESI